ncbi:matrixin family metalloprotease [Flavivirga spongiicola]|uniref:Matrixin family metalloprotease n=1 Tax=Flavivirga spongiicola TaxID=421621 RepID=A0ABU7XQM8_9FLAO|nr:matrixin family metalloprotease [Flavivirga sp. MEBiC05379]MDO5978055.1 matrixin family metalloprotease [Flavivirga sp. MEBiC05379]
MGVNKNDIQDKGAYYLVQGDMVFDKNKEYSSPTDSNLSKGVSSKASILKQRRTAFSVTINNINIFLNPGMNTNWLNASRSAIARWNAVNSNLNLTEVFSAASAHIQIMYDTQDPNQALAANVFGAALPPTLNGLPGTITWINPDFSFPIICGQAITQNNRIANVQHELGHNLGLHHTNAIGEPLIPNTPSTDPGSLMNGGQACTISDFSNNDERAIQFLFPIPIPVLTPSSMTLNTQQPGGLFTVTGTGPVTVTLSGGAGIFLHDGIGGSFLTTLNLTAPTTFSAYGPSIGSPGYNGGISYVTLSNPTSGIISSSTVYHSN